MTVFLQSTTPILNQSNIQRVSVWIEASQSHILDIKILTLSETSVLYARWWATFTLPCISVSSFVSSSVSSSSSSSCSLISSRAVRDKDSSHFSSEEDCDCNSSLITAQAGLDSDGPPLSSDREMPLFFDNLFPVSPSSKSPSSSRKAARLSMSQSSSAKINQLWKFLNCICFCYFVLVVLCNF